jgi:hypothetical protein
MSTRNVRLLHAHMPQYFAEKRLRQRDARLLDSITEQQRKIEHFWDMAGLCTFLFLLLLAIVGVAA